MLLPLINLPFTDAEHNDVIKFFDNVIADLRRKLKLLLIC